MEAATFNWAPTIIGGILGLIGLGIAYILRRDLDGVHVRLHELRKMKLEDEKSHRLEVEKDEQRHRLETEKYERKLIKLLDRSQTEMQEKTDKFFAELKEEREKSRKYLSDRKSTEVRTGHILEKVAPLFEDFPGDIIQDNVIPVFKTFDYLVIKDDEVILVEVKSGNAGLSTRQKKLKKLIEEGKVSFKTFRKRGTEGDSNGGEKASG